MFRTDRDIHGQISDLEGMYLVLIFRMKHKWTTLKGCYWNGTLSGLQKIAIVGTHIAHIEYIKYSYLSKNSALVTENWYTILISDIFSMIIP